MDLLERFRGCSYKGNTRTTLNTLFSCKIMSEITLKDNNKKTGITDTEVVKSLLESYSFIKRSEWNSFVSLLVFDITWVVVSITCFQFCNIESEPQKPETVYFLKLNNTPEYSENNPILFLVIKYFLSLFSKKIIFQ